MPKCKFLYPLKNKYQKLNLLLIQPDYFYKPSPHNLLKDPFIQNCIFQHLKSYEEREFLKILNL